MLLPHGKVMADNGDQGISIGRIPLKQVRVKRGDDAEGGRQRNPMNALVPFLDLFCRLNNEELAKLAQVDPEWAANLREQVVAVDEGLAAYADLLPRLTDEELVRLTGATPKTIRFWRLCQPRIPVELVRAYGMALEPTTGGWVAAAARQLGGMRAAEQDGRRPAPSELEPQGPSDSGLHEVPRHPSESARARRGPGPDPFAAFVPTDPDEDPSSEDSGAVALDRRWTPT